MHGFWRCRSNRGRVIRPLWLGTPDHDLDDHTRRGIRDPAVTDPTEIPPGNYRVSWLATTSSPYGENFVVYIQGQSKVC
jgi:hypothetical protein